MSDKDIVLFKDEQKLTAGGVFRYRIEYTPHPASMRHSIWMYVHNLELSPLRAAYLSGPYTLYVDMRPERFNDERVVHGPADEPKYNHNVRAGQHFGCQLFLRGPQKHVWYVDVVGEQLFNRKAQVRFQIYVATTKQAAKRGGEPQEDAACSFFKVNIEDSQELWSQPIPDRERPLHLVILTHGLMSNVSADMLYLKEEIDKQAAKDGVNLICKGYTGNIGKTEKGVKYLGRRVAEWLMFEILPAYKPKKMSFIGHSLGGLTQTYALGYIQHVQPACFQDIIMENFICMASPLLGISTENPGYVKMALDFGFVGKTGRDLGLSWQPGFKKPILKSLPTGPTHEMLTRFKHLTIYANSVNDGIVPLRTSSLLYLDWRAISKATAAKKGKNAAHYDEGHAKDDTEDLEVKSLTEFPTFEVAGSKPWDKKAMKQIMSDDGTRRSEPDKTAPNATTKEGRKHGGSTGSTQSINKVTNAIDNVWSFFNIFDDSHAEKKRLRRYQTVRGSDSSDDSDTDNGSVPVPKKTSLLESGLSLLISPLPNSDFICDPKNREDVIFHDRLYHESDLPPRRYRTQSFHLTKSDKPKETARNEERIARAWHKGVVWRKVLVQLLPEAHNNIIVRRRFTNAYGWPVIHHVVQNHFTSVVPREDDLSLDGDDAEYRDQLETAEVLEMRSVCASIVSLDLVTTAPEDMAVSDEVDTKRVPVKNSEGTEGNDTVRRNAHIPPQSESDGSSIDETWFDPANSDDIEDTSSIEVYV